MDKDSGAVPPACGAGVDQSISQEAQPHRDLNCVKVGHPGVVYSRQTIALQMIRMRSASPYQSVRIDPVVTVFQLPPPPPEEADVLPVVEQCMGWYYCVIAHSCHTKVLQLQCGRTLLLWCVTHCNMKRVLPTHTSILTNRR